MASSEIDQKFLGKLAKHVERENPLLASILFKILGLSLNLSSHLIRAKKQRRLDTSRQTQSLELYYHIIWLSREGLVLLEQYVLPMVGNAVELKVLAFKLRASFYHVFVRFHNTSTVSGNLAVREPQQASTPRPLDRLEKGKDSERDDDDLETTHSSVQRTHHIERGGWTLEDELFGCRPSSEPVLATAFLVKAADYLPQAHQCFHEAVQLADDLLWGSHSLRLSVKTEYAAFLYECAHEAERSRQLAKETISEVYDATEGIDNDMFTDACELVKLLGRMMQRGLSSSTITSENQAQGLTSERHETTKGKQPPVTTTAEESTPPPRMI